MARATTYQLEGLAAMPGLEELASPLVPYLRGPGDRHAEAMGMLVFMGFSRVYGSAEMATAEFLSGHWQVAVNAAARVGRTLKPNYLPTADIFRHMIDRAAADKTELGDELARAFTPAMAPLVTSAGLLRPDAALDPARPERENTIYGDGSVFTAMSDVYVDSDTGEAHGSRAKSVETAKIPARHHGKRDSGGEGTPGSPITLIGVHGGARYQRAVLAVGNHDDFAEITCAMRLFHSVIDTYGSGVHASIYDKLMSPVHMLDLIRAGVVPMVDVSNANTTKNIRSLPVPAELQEKIGRAGQPVTNARLDRLGVPSHFVGGRECPHDVWALGGSLRSTVNGVDPSFADPTVEQVSMHWDTRDGHRHLIGRYRIPCQHGSFIYEVDFTGTFTVGDDETPIVQVLRPISPTDALTELRGRRSDVESVFSTVKSTTPNGRATRLKTDHFLIDVIGAGLWQNSILWDVHAARFTRHAKNLHAEDMRRAARDTCLK